LGASHTHCPTTTTTPPAPPAGPQANEAVKKEKEELACGVEDLQAEVRELQEALAASQQQRRVRRASLVMMTEGSDMLAPPQAMAHAACGMRLGCWAAACCGTPGLIYRSDARPLALQDFSVDLSGENPRV
jgi:hypothetical protein